MCRVCKRAPTMPLTIEQLRDLAAEAIAWRATPWTAPVAATDVLPHLDSDDRNIRVAALRVLASTDGPDAVTGILRGLDDPVKRVREVAAKSSAGFLNDERIV